MIKKKLNEIADMVNGSVELVDIEINGVSIDTRTLTKNNLYIPIVGDNFDGHDFLLDAIKKGAKASLWSKDELPDVEIPLIKVDDTLKALQSLAKKYRDSLNVFVVGITGTNGKTSTKDILGGILTESYNTIITQGNLNNHIGVPLTLLKLSESTQMAVVEMGMSNLGEIELLSKIASPDVAVITNVGKAHLENLKTIDNVAKAKLEIISGLKPDGLFIYNGDDPVLTKSVNDLQITQSKKTFGEKAANDLSFKIVNTSLSGTTFLANEEEYHLSMIGKHQVYNASASILAAQFFNVDETTIKTGLNNVKLTSMRSELIESNNFFILNDAYNCNPESTKAALDTFYSLKGYSQKIVVFADMLELGENEIKLHKEIGKTIDFNNIDYLLTYGQLAKHTANEANGLAYSFNDKKEIVKMLKNIIRNDSIILLKGSRGMKLEEIADALV